MKTSRTLEYLTLLNTLTVLFLLFAIFEMGCAGGKHGPPTVISKNCTVLQYGDDKIVTCADGSVVVIESEVKSHENR